MPVANVQLEGGHVGRRGPSDEPLLVRSGGQGGLDVSGVLGPFGHQFDIRHVLGQAGTAASAAAAEATQATLPAALYACAVISPLLAALLLQLQLPCAPALQLPFFYALQLPFFPSPVFSFPLRRVPVDVSLLLPWLSLLSAAATAAAIRPSALLLASSASLAPNGNAPGLAVAAAAIAEIAVGISLLALALWLLRG